jgi:hypothetical protein
MSKLPHEITPDAQEGHGDHINLGLSELPQGLPRLADLIADGWTSQGINYGCGCTKSAWFHHGVLMDTFETYCGEHENNRDHRLQTPNGTTGL